MCDGTSGRLSYFQNIFKSCNLVLFTEQIKTTTLVPKPLCVLLK